jgi:hypothetical protein
MKTPIRRTAVGVAAGLAILLAAPAIPAMAANNHPSHGHSSWHENNNPAQTEALKALKAAVKTANETYETALKNARNTFNADATVIAAKATRDAVTMSSTDANAIQAAREAYALAIAVPQATKDASYEAATTAWNTAIDNALAAYDVAVATSPTDAAANVTYRAAIRSARTTYAASMKSANSAYKTATATASATRRAAVNSALATYNASTKDAAAALAYRNAVLAAKAAYKADATVVAAEAARTAAKTAARTTLHTSLTDARTAYKTATGHEPTRFSGLPKGLRDLGAGHQHD